MSKLTSAERLDWMYSIETGEPVVADLSKEILEEVPRLRRYALALTRNSDAGDDLVQECLERALTRQHLWQDGTNLRAWLFTIVHNQHVEHVRQAARRGVTIELSDAEPLLMRSGGQEARHALRDFDRALAQLPEQQRAAILLIGVDGLSYARAAEAMGCPVGTVRSRLCRGREMLHRLMEVPHEQVGSAFAA